jgi:hypothetical protein
MKFVCCTTSCPDKLRRCANSPCVNYYKTPPFHEGAQLDAKVRNWPPTGHAETITSFATEKRRISAKVRNSMRQKPRICTKVRNSP